MTVTPGALEIEPGPNFALIEPPIFAETEPGKTIPPSPARALIDPGHRYLQQLGNFLHAEQRAPRMHNLREFFDGGHRVQFRTIPVR
jgi:hypothetical protein